MGSSGNLACTVFFWYSQEAYFTPWAGSVHVTAGYVANIGSVSQLKSSLNAGVVNQSLSPRSPHKPWCIVPSPEMLHHLVDSVPAGTPAGPGTCHPHWCHCLPGLSALNGWVHIPVGTLPGHKFIFLWVLFPKWTNLCEQKRATFSIIVSTQGVISAPTEEVVDILPLLFWMACLQVVFSKPYT